MCLAVSDELSRFTSDFALSIEQADGRAPQAASVRSKRQYQSGIGPFTEPQAVRLIAEELKNLSAIYTKVEDGVPYPHGNREKCDLSLRIGENPWAFEIKVARFKGDNGKPADQVVTHLLSPYPADRSALTDCRKLDASGFDARRAIIIYGFDFEDRSLDPVIDAFECLASELVRLGPRTCARFQGLIHPVHRHGRVFAWEVFNKQ